jgi:hypothetical protein
MRAAVVTKARCVLGRSAVVAMFATAAAAPDRATAATTTLVDVPTRSVTQRFLYVRPDAPVANIVFLPGLDGVLGIEDDGSTSTLAGHCAPFMRNREAFASRGFALALVDRTSDHKVRQFVDVNEVVRYMRRRDDVPTWIVGGSGSTMGALDFAVEYPRDERLGVVIFSPAELDAPRIARVTRPTLVVYHRDDDFSGPFVGALFDALTAAPARERIELTGGGGGSECGGPHLFTGIDAKFVDAITGFIQRHNAFGPSLEPNVR